VPFQRLGETQLVAGHLAWRVPGLVNIQKAIENGDLQLIYPLKMVIFYRFL
jgi:hypothetical protein